MSGAVISATMNRRRKEAQLEQTRSPKPPPGRLSHFEGSMKQSGMSGVLNESHLLKIENNQVYMLTRKEVVENISGLLRDQQKMRKGYCNCLFFFIFVVLYLSVLSYQWNTVEMHDQYRAIRNEILGPLMNSDGYVVDSVANSDFIIDDWLKVILEPIFKDKSCGDAKVSGMSNASVFQN